MVISGRLILRNFACRNSVGIASLCKLRSFRRGSNWLSSKWTYWQTCAINQVILDYSKRNTRLTEPEVSVFLLLVSHGIHFQPWTHFSNSSTFAEAIPRKVFRLRGGIQRLYKRPSLDIFTKYYLAFGLNSHRMGWFRLLSTAELWYAQQSQPSLTGKKWWPLRLLLRDVHGKTEPAGLPE